MRTRKDLKGVGIAITALAVLVLAPFVGIGALPASAGEPLNVRITIDRVRETIGDVEPGGEADYYAVVFVDGQKLGPTDVVADDNDITPSWELSTTVDSDLDSVPVSIEIWDSDSFLRGDDEQADISPIDGKKVVDLILALEPCGITGDLTGDCGATLESGGNSGGSAAIEFRVEVDEPVSTEDLRVRCLHRPIWPQPGETVRIKAESLDPVGQRTAETVEIWVDDTEAPAHTANGTASTDVGFEPANEDSLTYGCRITRQGQTVWSGWHTVTIGEPENDEAIPVLYTGPRSSRLDFVFIADRDDYPSSDDPSFQYDVHNVIRDAYYDVDTFLVNQDLFNFWIAFSTGNAEDYEEGCDHSGPDISWMDAGVILHKSDIRDCAMGGTRLFSAKNADPDIVLHESGHRPFGLADEYCCDGGYYQNEPFPNLYHSFNDFETPHDGTVQGCATDAPNLGRTEEDCRSFQDDVRWWFDETWYTSEPPANDLMVDNKLPWAADIRRFEWVLENCRSARC